MKEPTKSEITKLAKAISKTIETIDEAFERGVAYGREQALREIVPEQQEDKSDDIPPLEAAMRDQIEAQKRGDTFGEIRAMIRVCAFVPALCREIGRLREELAEARGVAEIEKTKSDG